MCAYVRIRKLGCRSFSFWNVSPSNYFTVQMIKKKEQRATDAPKLPCVRERVVCLRGSLLVMRAAAGSCVDKLLKRAQRPGAGRASQGQAASAGAGGRQQLGLRFQLMGSLHSEYQGRGGGRLV